jgi:N-acetylglutamate synthase-like GNAT family acetyltransferase
MIEGKLLTYGDDLTEVFSVRRKVFVEEQGITEEMEFDALDEASIHAIVYNNEAEEVNSTNNKKSNGKKAVATGRIIYDGVNCTIEKIGVLEDYRGRLYGDFTVRMLLNKAFTSGINEVFLHTQINTEGFFQKIGFHKVGANFSENGKSCCKMIIYTQDINKICCKRPKK